MIIINNNQCKHKCMFFCFFLAETHTEPHIRAEREIKQITLKQSILRVLSSVRQRRREGAAGEASAAGAGCSWAQQHQKNLLTFWSLHPPLCDGAILGAWRCGWATHRSRAATEMSPCSRHTVSWVMLCSMLQIIEPWGQKTVPLSIRLMAPVQWHAWWWPQSLTSLSKSRVTDPTERPISMSAHNHSSSSKPACKMLHISV